MLSMPSTPVPANRNVNRRAGPALLVNYKNLWAAKYPGKLPSLSALAAPKFKGFAYHYNRTACFEGKSQEPPALQFSVTYSSIREWPFDDEDTIRRSVWLVWLHVQPVSEHQWFGTQWLSAKPKHYITERVLSEQVLLFAALLVNAWQCTPSMCTSARHSGCAYLHTMSSSAMKSA